MKHKAWSSWEDVPYYCSRSSVKFWVHRGQKITNFDLNWAFPDCNSSLNSPMALKWGLPQTRAQLGLGPPGTGLPRTPGLVLLPLGLAPFPGEELPRTTSIWLGTVPTGTGLPRTRIQLGSDYCRLQSWPRFGLVLLPFPGRIYRRLPASGWGWFQWVPVYRGRR